VKILGEQIRYLDIVEVREGKVRVAIHANFGQMQELCLTAMGDHSVNELLCHHEASVPEVQPRVRAGDGRDDVSEHNFPVFGHVRQNISESSGATRPPPMAFA
jgi:hypothetical protein